ncbi:MAG: tetratricopeptide repeat protein [Gammaproteobacteria bacterium]
MYKTLAALLAAMSLAGCAATPPPDTAQPTAATPVAATPPASSTPRRPPLALTQDLLFKLLVAEFAVQRGQLGAALPAYMELARRVPDPQLAARTARIALYARRDREALEAARLWVKKDPADMEGRQVLAGLLLRGGRLDEAVQHLEAVLNSLALPANERFIVVANLLGGEKNKALALQAMERLVANRQHDADAQFAYALLALKANRLSAARQAMERALEVKPVETPTGMTYLGILQRQGDLRRIDAWMQTVIRDYPDQSDLRMAYGRLLADHKRYDEARAQFEALAEAQPDNAEVQFALGLLSVQNQDFDRAQGHFLKLTEHEQYRDEARYYLGQIEANAKHYQEAVRWYSSVGQGETYFDAQLHMALTRARQGDMAQAEAQLRRIEPLSDQQKDRVVQAQAEIYSEQGRYREAMRVYDEALGDRYDAELLYNRAMVAEKMGRLDLVERDLRRIIAREPEHALALNALGYSLADRSTRYQEALALIQRALALSPNDFYTLDSMGWVLYRLGRLKEAETHLRRAFALRADPEVAAHLGEVLWMLGERDEARTIWSRGLETSPADRKVLDVMRRLTPL